MFFFEFELLILFCPFFQATMLRKVKRPKRRTIDNTNMSDSVHLTMHEQQNKLFNDDSILAYTGYSSINDQYSTNSVISSGSGSGGGGGVYHHTNKSCLGSRHSDYLENQSKQPTVLGFVAHSIMDKQSPKPNSTSNPNQTSNNQDDLLRFWPEWSSPSARICCQTPDNDNNNDDYGDQLSNQNVEIEPQLENKNEGQTMKTVHSASTLRSSNSIPNEFHRAAYPSVSDGQTTTFDVEDLNCKN